MTFSNRHDVETRLAEISDGGVIVEVGVGKGDGLVALHHGNKVGRLLQIFAVDPYLPYVDRLGGTYGPECRAIAEQKAQDYGVTRWVTFIEEDGKSVGDKWELPVALCWIDVSMDYAGLKPIFDTWARHIIDDGHIAIAGYRYSNLGTRQVAEEAVATGDFEWALTEQDFVAVLKRKPRQKRAVFYITAGEGYADEADYSASSVKINLPGAETFLFAVGGTKARPHIDHVIELPERRHEMWYLDSTRYWNIAVETLHQYNSLLYLDTDTWVGWPCNDIWWLLDKFDLALGHSAGRDAMVSAIGTPPAFTTLSVGVCVFRNNAEVRATFADWLAFYEKYQVIYENNDESPLRDVLWVNPHGLKIYVLPPEYSCRAGFGTWVYGRVRIVHARLPRLHQMARILNEKATMRMWRPDEGYLWYHEPK